MDIQKIEDLKAAPRTGLAATQNIRRRCAYYKEEACLAPRIKFQLCRTCGRINLRLALRDLFIKIKALASSLMKV
jgi:hypothetical protein